MSFLSPGLVPLSYFSDSLTSFGSFLGFFSFLSSSAFCSACSILYHQWCNEYVDCKRLGNPHPSNEEILSEWEVCLYAVLGTKIDFKIESGYFLETRKVDFIIHSGY